MGEFGLPNAIQLQEVPADFVAEALRLFLAAVLQLHLEEQARSVHRCRFAPFYTKRMACAICETRRPRRYCPGVRGEICTLCCGTEREVSVSCPLDCEYLRDARKHEKPVDLDEEQIPNRDIRITEEFLEEHENLLMFLGGVIASGALATDGVVDFDVRQALDALVRTYRTLVSGVYYESVPPNPLAAAMFRRVQDTLQEARRRETQQLGITRTRDADVLGALAFLQRLEYDRNNGRKRGRAFVDFLREVYESAAEPEAPPTSPLVLP